MTSCGTQQKVDLELAYWIDVVILPSLCEQLLFVAGLLPRILAGVTSCIHPLYHLETCDKHFKKNGCRGVLKRVHPIELLLMKGGLSKNKDISHQDLFQNSVKHLAEEP